MPAPLQHPPVPQPGELGPDPEPIGTERFLRLMSRIETQRPLPPEALVMPVDRHRLRPEIPDQAAA